MSLNKNNKSGFTLVEILVVVAIIGLLAGLGSVGFNNARQKGRDARRITDIQAVRKAMDSIKDDNGYYAIDCSGANEEINTCDFLSYLDADNIFDPAKITTACDGTNAGNCNYSFWVEPTRNHFLFYFRLEMASQFGNTGEANCAASQTMVACDDNVSWTYCSGADQASDRWSVCKIYDFNGTGNVNSADALTYVNE